MIARKVLAMRFSVYIMNTYTTNTGQHIMARKGNVYTVDKNTNTILRVSKTYLAALEFRADMENPQSAYLCTSEFQNLKKGDPISCIVDFLDA